MPWRYPDNVPAVARNWSPTKQRTCTLVAERIRIREGWDDASEEERKEIERKAIFGCIRAAGMTEKSVVVIDKRGSSEVFVPIFKYDEFRGELTGPVLIPGKVDSQDDIYTATEIKRACAWYNKQRSPGAELDLQHKRMVGEQEARVLKSWVIGRDAWMEGNEGRVLMKGGTWLMTVKLLSERLKALAKSGEIAYFSVRGVAKRTPVRVLRDAADRVKRILRVRRSV